MKRKWPVAIIGFLITSVLFGTDVPPVDKTIGESRDYTPLQLSIVPRLPFFELPWWCEDVRGVRFNLLGGNTRSLSYFDLGTLANLVEGEASGLQICGLYNHVGTSAGLVQFAGLVNRIDQDCTGLQLGTVYNETSGRFKGLGLAAMNHCKELKGAQVGIFNNAQVSKGFQFGLVNFAEEAGNGLQIGLINIMPNADIPVSILCNAGFWRK